MDANASILEIKGIGKKTAELFEELGVRTIYDLLHYFPRAYEQYPEISAPDNCEPGKMAAFYLHVQRAPSVNTRSAYKTAVMDVPSQRRRIRLIWFRIPYIRSLVKKGRDYVFYGRFVEKDNIFYLEQPKIFDPMKYEQLSGMMQPVYSLTKGLSMNLVRNSIRRIFGDMPHDLEYLPDEIRRGNHLVDYDFAIHNIHFPDSEKDCIEARRRFAFDEFFLFTLQMQLTKKQTVMEENTFSFLDDGYMDELIKQLPFSLTSAQQRTIREVEEDMRAPVVMQRLIQGDVGSGKTAVAFLAMLFASHNGYQAAIMAPTDVLARQHYEKLSSFCRRIGVSVPVVLLTGSLKAAQKKEALSVIANHPGALIVGTHALIQEGVDFCSLALVVTDEQHRFGVSQRKALARKGMHPHVLVMSATPIPRTLAIILYGDLSISVIDESPASRLPVKSCVVTQNYRRKAFSFIAGQIDQGHQAYIVCPLVEASEEMDGENVQDYSQMLRSVYDCRYTVGVLHGRMKPEEKNRIMEQFLENKIQILVSTTVIEVGVDVPNATVMMIENADRYGLAQLHQLRGRVGRGKDQSYCIFMQSHGKQEVNPRLEILNQSNDGFFIAREDLKLRGPGDFFGIRQSGAFSFQVGDVYRDMDLLQDAASAAMQIIQEDPNLQDLEHQSIKRRLQRSLPEDFDIQL